MENMKRRMHRRTPSEDSEPAESIKVKIIVCSVPKRFISLKTRPMRSARRMVATLPTSKSICSILRISILNETVTIMKSNMFHESLKYAVFKAMIFRIASIVKMIMNV